MTAEQRNAIIRRAILAVLVACAVVFIPWEISKLNYDSLWPMNLVQLPGVVVAMVFAKGNGHDMNLFVTLIASVAFWGITVYLLLLWFSPDRKLR